MMTLLLGLIVLFIAVCALYLWWHPHYDDCLLGRIALLAAAFSGGVIIVSIWNGYTYTNVRPEIFGLLISFAIYIGWIVWRFIRKRRRIKIGLDTNIVDYNAR